MIYVNPASDKFGLVAFVTEVLDAPIFVVAYRGGSPEQIEVLAVAWLDSHTDGQERTIEMRADKPGEVTFWVDGDQIELGIQTNNSSTEPLGLDPLIVDPEIATSTKHGFAISGAIAYPKCILADLPGIERISIQEQ